MATEILRNKTELDNWIDLMQKFTSKFLSFLILGASMQANSSESRVDDVFGCNGDIMFENLMNGKSIHLKQHDGKTALHMAAFYGNTELIEVVINVGGNVDELDDSGLTPLVYAIGTGQVDPVRFLISRGADINKRIQNERTALFYVYANADVAQLLIEAGADVNALDKFGKSPLWYALERSKSESNISELIQLLKKFGAKAVSKNSDLVTFTELQRESTVICMVF